MFVPEPVTVRVPAKVNVYLGVGPRESNGYHGLATVFQSISVYDEVSVTASDEFTIVGEGKWADRIPTDATNLAWKAAHMVAKAYELPVNVCVTINKSIPVAAGLAGGSADGAATLVACNAYWGGALPHEALVEMAAELGSDVPFMLSGGCALGVNRGDILSPVMTRGIFHWVLATFNEGLGTPEIYARLDEMRPASFDEAPSVPTELLAALAQGNAEALGQHVFNDLQAPAIASRPVLGRVLEFGESPATLGGLVSGSGPTVAFLVETESDAIDFSITLLGSGLVDGAIHAHGPVHGARVIPS